MTWLCPIWNELVDPLRSNGNSLKQSCTIFGRDANCFKTKSQVENCKNIIIGSLYVVWNGHESTNDNQ